ncbi:Yip1 family protein [Haloferax namakaokahaiae]|uniref:Yip1 family protein n=1 Tax=Haloferax namakaokahaiae TaxID=1748331 RepID=A0ABD5ZHE4_9EURY
MAGPRTPLLKPRAYFDSKSPPLDLQRAALVVAVATLVVAVSAGGILWTFTQQLDQTVAVDNPNHWPDHMCENYEAGGGFEDMPMPSGCDSSVPETLDKRLGDLVWEEIGWIPWAVLVGTPLVWLFEAVVLHLGGTLVGGSGRFTDTLAVAGWGMVPSAVRAVVVGSYLVYQFGSLDLPSNPDSALNVVQAALAPLDLVSTLVALVVVAWATYVRTYGLARARDISVGDAAVVTVSLSFVGFLISLA